MKRILSCFLALALLLTVFTGCGSSLPDGYAFGEDGHIVNTKPAVSIVILGNHGNSMELSDEAYTACEELCRPSLYGGSVAVILNDGNPTLIEGLFDDSFFKESSNTVTNLTSKLSSRGKKLSEALRSTGYGEDPETDLFKSLKVAADYLSKYDNTYQKNIIVADTGLTSSSLSDINMVELFRDAPAGTDTTDAIIHELQTRAGIGVFFDLSPTAVTEEDKTTITFIGDSYGLVPCAAPQEMETTDAEYIKDLWSKITEQLNAKFVHKPVSGWSTPIPVASEGIDSSNTDEIAKPVTVITFKKTDHAPVLVDPSNTLDAGSTSPNIITPVLNIDIKNAAFGNIQFKADSDEFVDQGKAIEVLQNHALEIQSFLNTHPGEKVYIAGQTAWAVKGPTQDDYTKSLQRATAVKSALVAAGIDSDSLVVLSLGCLAPWRVEENDQVTGAWSTVLAEANRSTTIFSRGDNETQSDYYVQLKAAYQRGELMEQTMAEIERLHIFE